MATRCQCSGKDSSACRLSRAKQVTLSAIAESYTGPEKNVRFQDLTHQVPDFCQWIEDHKARECSYRNALADEKWDRSSTSHSEIVDWWHSTVKFPWSSSSPVRIQLFKLLWIVWLNQRKKVNQIWKQRPTFCQCRLRRLFLKSSLLVTESVTRRGP